MTKKLKKIVIKNIPLGVNIDIRVDINKIDVDFYNIGDYIKINNNYYKVIEN